MICFVIGIALWSALEEAVGGEGGVSGIIAEGEIGAAFMTNAELKFAGWLSITNATLAIPIIIILIFLEAKVSYAILTLLNLFLFVYIFLSFRKLVSYQSNFSLVNVLISVMIWLYTALALIDVLETAGVGGPFLFSVMGEDINLADILFLATIILFGIVSCVFAAVLLVDLRDNLFGLLKPFSYATITGGVCIATVFLLPVGLVALIVRDVILSMIFFKAVGLSTRQPI